VRQQAASQATRCCCAAVSPAWNDLCVAVRVCALCVCLRSHVHLCVAENALLAFLSLRCALSACLNAL
jgi:hypothetical protein